MVSDVTSPGLDDLLLDIATAIELSDRDRRVADRRYRLLKEHLERKTSPLAPYLIDTESRIYPQGSIAIGTTIVSGTEDDRYDVDALVELTVPSTWSPEQVLDLLWGSLQGFPDAKDIVRCTRCVQIQFAFMHMDVTVLDPQQPPRIERAGEIFHSPDAGESYRVPANPYGFSWWFRQNVHAGSEQFSKSLARRRATNGIDRLSNEMFLKSIEQEDLPPILPPRLDSEKIVALKLLKRYMNLRYENREIKKPPSIYTSKLTTDVPDSLYGLCVQLEALTLHVKNEMRRHISEEQFPDERNPTYNPDMLNDRWPKTKQDMVVLEKDMGYLIAELERARMAEFSEITKIVSGLFGENITQRSVEKFLKRAEKPGIQKGLQYEKGTGTVVPNEAVVAPAIRRKVSQAPAHAFHCEIL